MDKIFYFFECLKDILSLAAMSFARAAEKVSDFFCDLIEKIKDKYVIIDDDGEETFLIELTPVKLIAAICGAVALLSSAALLIVKKRR